ncbi:Lar family restriction alleviation protein [Yersinia aleksiciae]|uniref:Lar family restriction alleviation protein n=1 Tax=Yersinia aleksiciae TaxID=263819 RepID=UPI0011A398FB|nr:Lar family restriction alleviation protein [Yersinia aleksiciae]
MSENTDGKLKPCPFCGGEAHLLTSNGMSFLVECSICLTDFLNGPVGIGWYRSEKDAAADWNERPSDRALKAQLEAAQKEITDWRSVAEAAAQDDAEWHKLADSKNEVISQLAQGIIQLKESAEQNVKALNRVAHQRDKAFADIEAAEARLLVPVKLPNGTGWCSDPYNHGRNDGIRECKDSLKAAGFKVEGE